MNNRERFLAVMHYRDYDHLPVIHFGYWSELLRKWASEGHITQEEADAWGDGNEACRSISGKLGFDFGFETGRDPIRFVFRHCGDDFLKKAGEKLTEYYPKALSGKIDFIVAE